MTNTISGFNIRSKVFAVRLVLIFSVIIMAIKFVAYKVTMSNAVLSDALESLINIATSSFTLYSIYYSSKLRDLDHPYGHGKIEYLAVGFEGALIIGTGIYILFKSGYNLIHPNTLENVDEGIILTAISGLAMYFIGTYMKRKGKELNSLPLIADGQHFHVDTLTSVGLIVGLGLYHLTGLAWIDPLLAIALAIHIMMSGYKLTKESIDRLLDKADEESIGKIASSLQNNRHDNWIDIHNLRSQKFGHYIHVDCHLTLPFYLTLEKVHSEVKLLETELNRDFDHSVELFVHTDPCNEELPCDICSVKDCVFRKKAFVKSVEWTQANLIINKKHKLH
jgi:cation diffusion facilitator family transporter